MRSTPKISVVMPVHNGGKLTEIAAESILRQTYKDFELLIVDDGSTDETPETLNRLLRQDDRVRVLRNERRMGLGWTLNRALREARAEWIARMDADDVSHPERLARQVATLQHDPSIDVIGTQAVNIDQDGNPLGIRAVPLTHEAIRALLPWANPMIHPSVLFRRRAIDAVGSYDPTLTSVEDYDLWFRCVAAGLKLANLPDVLLGYRVTPCTYARRGWRYRALEMRVRWRGYKLLRCSPVQHLGLLVPVALFLAGRVPGPFAEIISRIGDKADPRRLPNIAFQQPGDWVRGRVVGD